MVMLFCLCISFTEIHIISIPGGHGKIDRNSMGGGVNLYLTII